MDQTHLASAASTNHLSPVITPPSSDALSDSGGGRPPAASGDRHRLRHTSDAAAGGRGGSFTYYDSIPQDVPRGGRRAALVKHRLHIQLETISPTAARVLVYVWIGVLAVSTLLQAFPSWQWSCQNICGGEYYCNIANSGTWDSTACGGIVDAPLLPGGPTAAPSTTSAPQNGTHNGSTTTMLWQYPVASLLPVDFEKPSPWIDLTSTAPSFVGCDNDQFAGSGSGSGTPPSNNNNNVTGLVCAQWNGTFGSVGDSKYNRFLHVLLSFPNPVSINATLPAAYNDWNETLAPLPSGQRQYHLTPQQRQRPFDFIQQLNYTVVFFEADGARIGPMINGTYQTFCVGGRCTLITMVVPIATDNATRVSILVSSSHLLWALALDGGAITAVYQNAAYTILSIAVRYLLLIPAVLYIVRFLWTLWKATATVLLSGATFRTGLGPAVSNRSLVVPTEAPGDSAGHTADRPQGMSSVWRVATYEQYWVFALQVSLLFYLDPVFVWGILQYPESSAFTFIEIRMPYYFLGFVEAFVLAVTTSASLRLRFVGNPVNVGRAIVSVFLVLFLVALVVVDLLASAANNYDWSQEHCPNLQCSPLGYAFFGLVIFGAVLIVVWLMRLRWLLQSTGASYIETRREQLALRLFVFVFTSYVVYFLIATLIRWLAYGDLGQSLVGFHPMLSVGTVATASIFVGLMSYSFSTVVRSGRMPPESSRGTWKAIPWISTWFHWLSLHGGYAYFFNSQSEEETWTAIQEDNEYTTRADSQDVFTPAMSGRNSFAAYNNDDSPNGGADDADRKSVARMVLATSANLLEAVEDRIVDVSYNLTSRMFASSRKHFFNLETAIDAFNLAYEAYGVPESAGDVEISTGLELAQLLPAVGLNNIIFGRDGQFRGTSANESLATGSSMSTRDGASANGLGDPLVSASPSRTVSLGPDGGSTASGDLPPERPRTRSQKEADSKVRTPPINVAQYGYRVVGVGESEVQFIVCVMDRTAPQHRERKHGRIVIAFRGTDRMSNWRANCAVRRVDWDAMMSASEKRLRTLTGGLIAPSVHSGFLGVWNALRDRVMSCLRQHVALQSRDDEILVTGHSLGGAIAVLCAFDIATTVAQYSGLLKPPMVYTFGAPRVGNNHFCKAYDRRVPRTFRVVNERDVVSHLSVMGGAHCGVEVDIDKHGNLVCDPMFIEHLLQPGIGLHAADHLMSAYEESLNRLAEKSDGECPVKCLVPYVVVPPAVPLAEPPSQRRMTQSEGSTAVSISPQPPLAVSSP